MRMPVPWYFLHIPKTAGTTFRIALENHFHIERICPAYELHDVSRYSDEELRQFDLFRGHLGFNLVNYLPFEVNVLTLLRNPLERAVSHFEYICRDPGHHRHKEIRERGLDLLGYLRDPSLSVEIRNTQTRQLSHIADRNLLIELLEGAKSQRSFAMAWRKSTSTLPPEDEMLDLALERLESFVLVGLSERLEEALQLLAWLFHDRPPVQLQSLNVNAERTPLDDLAPAVIDALHEATALDQMLYARAEQIFDLQYDRLISSLLEEHYQQSYPLRGDEPALLAVDFSAPLAGRGWHQREILPGKGVIRWTGPGTVAELDVPLAPNAAYSFCFYIEDWASEEMLASLSVRIHGKPVTLVLKPLGNEKTVLCSGCFAPREDGPDLPFVRVTLETAQPLPQLVEGNGIDHNQNRRVGLAFSRFEFTPERAVQ